MIKIKQKIPTVKQIIIHILYYNKDKMHLKDIYKQVKKIRPQTPDHSVRGRLNESITKKEDIFVCVRKG